MSKGILVALAVLMLAIAGCGGTKATSSATTKADLAKAEVIVKGCVTKGKFSPHAFAACVAPPGHTAALESCSLKALTSDIPFHKKRLQVDLAQCVVSNR